VTAPATSSSTGLFKLLLGGALALVAVGAVAFGLIREARNSEAARATPAATSIQLAAAAAMPATVYYFHGDTRCPTCVAIENRTKKLVATLFPEDVAAGRVRFLVVNYDTPENRHFRQDFDLAFASVVVSDGKKWENLRDVWKLVHEDGSSFDTYVSEHILSYLKAAP
jgi:hypothetical protein